MTTRHRVDVRWWRRWHRWIGFPSAIFLLFVSVTGVMLAVTEFFGPDEALREATRDLVSPVTASGPAAAWSDPTAKALSAVNAASAGAPIDKGAGIRVLKKIGDRVEKDEPIYRIHAVELSEYELAVGAAKADAGYQIGGIPSAAGRPHP